MQQLGQQQQALLPRRAPGWGSYIPSCMKPSETTKSFFKALGDQVADKTETALGAVQTVGSLMVIASSWGQAQVDNAATTGEQAGSFPMAFARSGVRLVGTVLYLGPVFLIAARGLYNAYARDTRQENITANHTALVALAGGLNYSLPPADKGLVKAFTITQFLAAAAFVGTGCGVFFELGKTQYMTTLALTVSSVTSFSVLNRASKAKTAEVRKSPEKLQKQASYLTQLLNANDGTFAAHINRLAQSETQYDVKDVKKIIKLIFGEDAPAHGIPATYMNANNRNPQDITAIQTLFAAADCDLITFVPAALNQIVVVDEGQGQHGRGVVQQQYGYQHVASASSPPYQQ